jgi:hypothetical protein
MADVGYPPRPDVRDGDRIGRSRSGASVGRHKVGDERSTLSDSTPGGCQVDTFKIGERVVRFGSERAGTIWLEPSAAEYHRMYLFALGLLLLVVVAVSIFGALLSWYLRRKRSTLTCAALSLVCAGLAVLAFWAATPKRPPLDFVVPSEPPITFGRSREENRRPFELQSTQYTADWEVRLPPDEPSCRVRVSFQRAATDRELTPLIDVKLGSPEWSSWSAKRSYLYGVEPGRHELAILEDTGCEWSVTLKPGSGRPASQSVAR